MLVQRLVEYARQNSTTKPFHRQREFSWELCLSSHGVAARLDEWQSGAEHEECPLCFIHEVCLDVQEMSEEPRHERGRNHAGD